MKKYDSYKDSGIEWIGDIPEHWDLKKIKHTTYVKGRIGWQGLRSEEFLEEAESLVVTGTDFIDGKINWKTCYQIPIERYNEDINIQLKENDLLITKDGTIGKVSLVKNMPKIATLNSGVFLTRPSTNDYITEYMYWVLVSEIFKTFYDFNKSGSTIQHLYQYVFNEFGFTKPSIKEQKIIASYLDHKTTQIDTLISKKQQFISLLQEERIAVINQSVTKGLDPKVKMKDSGIEWLGEIPEHWEIKRLKYLIYKKIDNRGKTPPFGEEGRPMLEVKQIIDNKIYPSEKFEKYSKNEDLVGYLRDEVEEGDVLIATVGATAGKCCIVPYNFEFFIAQNVIGFRCNKETDSLFFYYIIESTYFKDSLFKINKSNTIDNLKVSVFINNECIVPPLEEQKKLSKLITDRNKMVNETSKKLRKEIELLEEYKTALISEVVTGKVDVRNEKLN